MQPYTHSVYDCSWYHSFCFTHLIVKLSNLPLHSLDKDDLILEEAPPKHHVKPPKFKDMPAYKVYQGHQQHLVELRAQSEEENQENTLEPSLAPER
jgi:hypothetical protein